MSWFQLDVDIWLILNAAIALKCGSRKFLYLKVKLEMMKSEQERKETIEAINVLLNQAYDSTLDEILAHLKRIDDIEDEEDLKAVIEARKDGRINGTVTWKEYKGYKRETA